MEVDDSGSRDFYLNAQEQNIENVSKVVAWQFSPLRETLFKELGLHYYAPKMIYIINAEYSVFPQSLNFFKEFSRLQTLQDRKLQNITLQAVKTTLIVYCSYMDIKKLALISQAEFRAIRVHNKALVRIDLEKEFELMKKNKDRLDDLRGVDGKIIDQFKETLSNAISPQLTNIASEQAETNEKIDRRFDNVQDDLAEIKEHLGISRNGRTL